jgi:hypothetical protein
MKWLTTVKEAGEAPADGGEDGAGRNGFPQPTGEFETIEADSLVLALGQDVDLGLLAVRAGTDFRQRFGRRSMPA